MSKNLTAKYYQKYKGRLQKKARENCLLPKFIKMFLKKKKKKRNNMVMNFTKFSHKIKKQKLVENRQKYYRMRKNAFL